MKMTNNELTTELEIRIIQSCANNVLWHANVIYGPMGRLRGGADILYAAVNSLSRCHRFPGCVAFQTHPTGAACPREKSALRILLILIAICALRFFRPAHGYSGMP